MTALMNNPICDMHIHTRFSCDSDVDLEDYCLAAIQKGVDVICFTDHLDSNPADLGYGYYDAKKYFNEYYFVKEKYSEKLTILCGIEFGDPHMYQDIFFEYMSMDFDYILATIHFWYKDLYPSVMVDSGVPIDICYEYYWDEVLQAVKAGGFDCLGHMDFPKRYYKGMVYDPDKISEIFRVMIANTISLEINTSNLRQQMTETMPDKELLSIYKESGGKYVTIGSDAHETESLSDGNNYAKKLIDFFGFEEVYFSKRALHSVF